MSVAHLFIIAAGHRRRHGVRDDVCDGCDDNLDVSDEKPMNVLMDMLE
jgi:hypothetical protein